MNSWSGQDAPKILIVDDDRSTRLLLRRAMEGQGYQVVEVDDGKACLAAYSEIQPDMVLLDALMPVMDGFSCCRQLQQLPGSDCTPVLMITALEDQASVDRAFEAGATDYITKPIHWAVLRQRVRRLIEQSRLYRQLEEANRALQKLAASDGLTQVANRRRFDEYLEQEWRRAIREQVPLSLILCDIDSFKRFNDTYGHQAGDDCLKQVAAAIQQTLKRPADLAARYGGEEFAMILPHTEANGAVQLAEAVRLHIQALAIPHLNSQVSQSVTLSLGVASMIPQLNQSSSSLVTLADKALYQAKAAGRDRVVLATEQGYFL